MQSPSWCNSIIGKLLRYEGNITELKRNNQVIK